MLGELTGGGLRGYYKLEDATDSSPNGYDLSTSGSVNYVSGRYSNCADFGNSGTTPGLYYGSNPFSTTTPGEVYFSFWFRLNSTSNTARNHFLFAVNTKSSATDGRNFSGLYTISGGNISLVFRRINSAGSAINNQVTFAASTDWIFVTMRFSISDTLMAHAVYNSKMAVIAENGFTSSNVGGSLTTDPTVYFTIGNSRALTQSAYADIDEFVMSEGIYTQSVSIDGGIDRSNRAKYREHLLGRLVVL